MKKKLLSLAIFVFVSFMVFGQGENAKDTTYWRFSGVSSLTFSQVSLTNWAAGGNSSYSLSGLLNMSYNYKKEKNHWDNTLELGYGIMKQEGEGVRKTDDKLDFLTKYGHQASKNWYYSASLNFKTQFATGYKYNDDDTRIKISNALAPAYLYATLGMDYKPTDYFHLLLSPATSKLTIITDEDLSNEGAFGVDPGKKSLWEFGAMVKSGFKKDIWKNVGLDTKVSFFSNYLDEPQNIDVDWELLITMKVNEYLSANLKTHLIYDNDIKYVDDQNVAQGPRVQFKEIFGAGFSLKF